MYLRTKKVSNWKQINFRNVDSMLSVQFIYDLYDQYNSTINWFRFKNVCLYYQDNKLWSFTPEDEWEKALDNIAKQFKNPKKYSNRDIIKNCYWYYERKEEVLEEFLKNAENINLDKLSNEELYELLFNWYQITLNQIYFINLAPVELGLQRAISELGAKDVLSSEEISTLYSLNDNTAVIKEEYALLKAIYNNRNKTEKEIISNHLKEYDYVTIGYGSKPLSEKVVSSRYKKIIKMSKETIKKRINEIESYPERIKEEKQIIINKLNNSQLIELFDLAAKLGFMRDRKKAFLGKSVKYRNKIVQFIEKRTGISNDNLKYYTLDDYYDLLILENKLDSEEIERRSRGIYISEISTLTSGEIAREEYFSSIKTEEENENMLTERKGVCASPGKIRGIARVCLTFEESNNLKKDEILVTYGTDFDFMNAIVKSKGIITEEGGILSHASVISRELKKPCIIAFKGITKIIKSGDLIELDAEEGTVEIINDEKNKENVSKDSIVGIYKLCDEVVASEVGNKAYNLAQLYKLNYNVPDAYFLATNFFETLLKQQDLYDNYVKYCSNLNKYKNEAYDLIDKVNIPTEFFQENLNFKKYTYAVRSSSPNEDGNEKSFAGQYITELFCNSIDFTINSIKKCWKSLLGVGLEKYQDNSENTLFGGIVVQRMIIADYSGVMFTKNPVSNNKDCIVIESCKGVASKLVDNRVVPDRYFINQETLEIIDGINKNDVPVEVIKKLAQIGKKLEKEYGCDMDIEWACKNGIIFLIQCRPITT